MSYEDKCRKWLRDCASIFNRRETEITHKKVLAAIAVNEFEKQEEEKKYSKKRFWVHPIFELRKEKGFYQGIFPTLRSEETKFRNYFRMSPTQFEDLLSLVAPIITKSVVIREPISAAERLCITLRYLASGDSMTSMSYQYLVGLTTISHIIEETCDAICTSLKDKVLQPRLSGRDWLNIAREFEEQWNFNHCIGAIDGKHVVIQCPDNAGSSYFNYKHSHSIVLLGICDANYKFTYVDIGAYGRRSDGGIFRDSTIGRKFKRKQMNLPDPEPISPGGKPLPYVLVGDEAFELTDYLLRPYPGRGELTYDRIIYNYRLSRARRTIENTFGIMVTIWRILRKPIICSVEKAMKIMQCIVCLHNWLRKQDIDIGINEYVSDSMIDRSGPNGPIPGSWREYIDGSAFTDITTCGNNNSSRNAFAIRDEFCQYFNSEGAVPWQFDNC